MVLKRYANVILEKNTICAIFVYIRTYYDFNRMFKKNYLWITKIICEFKNTTVSIKILLNPASRILGWPEDINFNWYYDMPVCRF